MKYFLFMLTLFGAFPAAMVCGMSRKTLALVVGAMFVVILKFDSMALNFISYEFYRGTARGMEVSLAYIIAFTVLLALAYRGQKISFVPDLGAFLFFAYLVWCVVSACSNDNQMALEGVMVDGVFRDEFLLQGRMLSFFEIWKMLMLWLVFAAVYGYLSHTGDLCTVLRALAVVCTICFLLVVKEHLAGVYQARGPFPHQNSLALFMMLAGPVFFAAYLNLPKSGFRTLCSVAFVCASAALFRTYSRGAMLCYPIASSVTVFQSLFCKIKMRTFTRLVPLAVCAVLGVMAILPRIVDRFENAPKQSGDTRKWLAITAYNVMRTKPWTGVGVNNWSLYVSTHPEAEDGAEQFRPNGRRDGSLLGIVETVYLLVGAECGFVGLGLLLGWFLYYWFVALRLCYRLAGTEWFFLPAGLLGGLSGCMLQSCLEWVLKQQLNFLLLVVVFALLSWMNKNWKRLREKPLISRRTS